MRKGLSENARYIWGPYLAGAGEGLSRLADHAEESLNLGGAGLGDPCAEQRSGVCGGEFVRNGSDPARLRDHDFRVSSVDRYPRRDRVLTVYDVSPSAGFTRTVFTARETNTDALT